MLMAGYAIRSCFKMLCAERTVTFDRSMPLIFFAPLMPLFDCLMPVDATDARQRR